MIKIVAMAALWAAFSNPLMAEEAVSIAAAAPESSLAQVASRTTVHGYIATDYYGGVLINDASQKNKIVPNFEQTRFVFGFLSELSDDIVFNSEVEFEHATRIGVKASTLDVAPPNCSTCTVKALSAASAGLEVEIEQAYVEFRRLDCFRPRAGVVLVPVGRLNINHDADTLATVERPLSDQQIMPTTWYEPAFGFTGQLELGRMGLAYEAYVINGLAATAADAGNEAKLRDLRMSKRADNDTNTDKALVGRVALQGLGAELGLSGYRGAYEPAGALYMTYGAIDGIYKLAGLELQGEWISLSADLPDQARVNEGHIAPSDAGYFKKTNPILTPFAGLRQGWYAQLLYTQAIGTWGSLQPFVNVSQIDPNVEIVTANDQTRYTYGLNYRPIEVLVVKLNYVDSQYVRGYTAANGSQSAVLDQRLQASLAWGF